MVPDKVIFLSSSDLVAQTNFCKLITRAFISNNKAVKIFSAFESLKQDVQDICAQKIGISPFTTSQKEYELLADFLISYRNLLDEVSEDFWRNRCEVYIENLIKNIPPQVRFVVTDVNTVDMLNVKSSAKFHLVRVEGKNKKDSTHKGFLPLSEFKKHTKNLHVHNFKMPNEKDFLTNEDVPDMLYAKIENFVNELFNSGQ